MGSRRTFNLDKHRNRFQTISYKELVARFEPSFHKPFAKAQDQLTEIVVFSADAKGKVRIDGDLVIDCRRANVVVDGDLVIDGNLVMSVDEGFGNFVLVTGDVQAHAICLTGFPELAVRGDVTCANGIIGMRGDDGGFFDVSGRVKAPVIVADTYFNFKFAGTVAGVTINTSQRAWKAKYTDKNVGSVVLPKYLDGDVDDEEGEVMLDSERAFAAIRAGKSILR